MPITPAQARSAARALQAVYSHRRVIRSTLRGTRRRLTYNPGRARALGRARRRTNVRRRIGDRPGTVNSKRVVTGREDVTSKSTKTFYTQDITDVSRGGDINDRERQLCYVSGWKIMLELRNKAEVERYCNIAFIALKDGVGETPTGDEWFRNYGADRNEDFPVAPATTLNGFEMHCTPINTDKYYVLKHMRFKLGALNDNTSGNQFNTNYGTTWRRCLWIPLKRQIRYKNISTSIPENARIFMCYWFSSVGTNENTAVVADALDMSYKIIMHFREPAIANVRFGF